MSAVAEVKVAETSAAQVASEEVFAFAGRRGGGCRTRRRSDYRIPKSAADACAPCTHGASERCASGCTHSEGVQMWFAKQNPAVPSCPGAFANQVFELATYASPCVPMSTPCKGPKCDVGSESGSSGYYTKSRVMRQAASYELPAFKATRKVVVVGSKLDHAGRELGEGA